MDLGFQLSSRALNVSMKSLEVRRYIEGSSFRPGLSLRPEGIIRLHEVESLLDQTGVKSIILSIYRARDYDGYVSA